MPSFSERSLRKLADCHPDLQRLFHEVIRHWDCTVLVGFRSREEQEAAFEQGHSEKHWPDSLHNKMPSLAVDVAPFPVDWNDLKRFYFFAGFVLGTARQMGINVRSGLDWSMDTQVKDQKLIDGPHYEIVGGSNANQVRPQEEV
jgi:hypothetical protein